MAEAFWESVGNVLSSEPEIDERVVCAHGEGHGAESQGGKESNKAESFKGQAQVRVRVGEGFPGPLKVRNRGKTRQAQHEEDLAV